MHFENPHRIRVPSCLASPEVQMSSKCLGLPCCNFSPALLPLLVIYLETVYFSLQHFSQLYSGLRSSIDPLSPTGRRSSTSLWSLLIHLPFSSFELLWTGPLHITMDSSKYTSETLPERCILNATLLLIYCSVWEGKEMGKSMMFMVSLTQQNCWKITQCGSKILFISIVCHLLSTFYNTSF